MKSSKIRLVVILGIMTIIGIIMFQVYWVLKTFDQKDKQFNQTISVALLNVAERLAVFHKTTLPIESPVKQLSSTYFVVNVNSEINPKILENFLKTEFDYRNIKIDYEYAIFDCATNEMVYGDYISSTSGKSGTHLTKKLPKYDKYLYYFGINFPTKTTYILSNMNIWLISSLILILACVFFGNAIYTILKQRRLTEIQKDFINNMTHEFKTPIATIAVSADVLLKPSIADDPERLHQYAAIIKEQNKRLERHVEDVLQVAISERSKVKLVKEKFDLHELIRQVLNSFSLISIHKKFETELDLKAEDTLITADRSHLTNVIYNLLDNAVKYSKDELKIKISTSSSDKSIMIIIEDNGIGIHRKHVKKIFRKFYRVPSVNINKVKGFGLGLSYVENIINAHHWKINLESEENKGCRFIIIIPRKHE
jgi:two-component system, OmpR family, phosphate regulon sensor histidine kinase PhoR